MRCGINSQMSSVHAWFYLWIGFWIIPVIIPVTYILRYIEMLLRTTTTVIGACGAIVTMIFAKKLGYEGRGSKVGL